MTKLFKVIAEGFFSGKLKSVDLPTESVNHRRLTVDEIKAYIVEEFEKAKDVEDVKPEEKDWIDADLEHQVDFIKTLNIKEFFVKKVK